MDTRRIAYRLHEGAIELLIWPSLDAAPGAKPEVFKVLPHVAQVVFSYLTADGRLVNSWPENPPTTQKIYFAPSALQISVQLDTGETVTRVFAI